MGKKIKDLTLVSQTGGDYKIPVSDLTSNAAQAVSLNQIGNHVNTQLGIAAEKAKVSDIDRDLAYTQETLDTVDDVLTPVPDYEALPLLCGQPPILFGAGTPQEAIVPDNWKQYDPQTNTGYQWNGQPSAVGQQYINTSASSGGRYIAVADANMNLTWKNF